MYSVIWCSNCVAVDDVKICYYCLLPGWRHLLYHSQLSSCDQNMLKKIWRGLEKKKKNLEKGGSNKNKFFLRGVFFKCSHLQLFQPLPSTLMNTPLVTGHCTWVKMIFFKEKVLINCCFHPNSFLPYTYYLTLGPNPGP